MDKIKFLMDLGKTPIDGIQILKMNVLRSIDKVYCLKF